MTNISLNLFFDSKIANCSVLVFYGKYSDKIIKIDLELVTYKVPFINLLHF